jgi:hypothetical protein
MFWFLYHFSDAQFLKLSINIRHKPQRKQPRWHVSFGPLSMSLMCLKWSDIAKSWVYEKYLVAVVSPKDQSARPCKRGFYNILYQESILMFGYQKKKSRPDNYCFYCIYVTLYAIIFCLEFQYIYCALFYWTLPNSVGRDTNSFRSYELVLSARKFYWNPPWSHRLIIESQIFSSEVLNVCVNIWVITNF